MEPDPTQRAVERRSADSVVQPEATPAQPNADLSAEVPDDYYVTLQPLTLNLIAAQLEHLNITFSQQADRIDAGWSSFVLNLRVIENQLNARATLRQAYPVTGIAALTGRCNWWNASRVFLKASAGTIISQAEPAEPGGERQLQQVARVYLDIDLPLAAGVAPVQLQALLQAMVRNIRSFEEQAQIDQLILSISW